MSTKDQRKDDILASIARLQNELAMLDTVEEPQGDAVVIFFQKNWGKNGKSYTYVGVKVDDGNWYVTAQDRRVRRPDGKLSWFDLLGFIDENEPTPPEILIGRGIETLRKAE